MQCMLTQFLFYFMLFALREKRRYQGFIVRNGKVTGKRININETTPEEIAVTKESGKTSYIRSVHETRYGKEYEKLGRKD